MRAGATAAGTTVQFEWRQLGICVTAVAVSITAITGSSVCTAIGSAGAVVSRAACGSCAIVFILAAVAGSRIVCGRIKLLTLTALIS